jgi:general secretion pathway protein A
LIFGTEREHNKSIMKKPPDADPARTVSEDRRNASRNQRHHEGKRKTTMYKSFYGLKEKPFSLLPDPAYLYLSKQHEMAMTLLEYSLENQTGFCVISGKAGTGKTTLLRRLLNQIGDDVSIGLISNTHHSFGELLRWILQAFSLEDAGKTRAQLHQIFVDYLIGQYAKNRRTMLIIDEAQNMSPDALEELRMLSNINSEKDLLLQVILVGQSPLREILRRPELEQFAQRIAVDYHLESLSHEETRGYIRHRIVVAGGEHELFSEDACDAVFEHSGGIPRLINLLCDFSLVYAYASQAAVVTGELVEQVVLERERYGALPVFAVTRKDRVKQGLPTKDTHSLAATKLPAAGVMHAARKLAATTAISVADSVMPAERHGKTVNALVPGTKHESNVETKVSAGVIDAKLSATSGTSLAKNSSAVTAVRSKVVTQLKGTMSYKTPGGIETEKLPRRTLPAEKRQWSKPDNFPDESALTERSSQAKTFIPPADNSSDAKHTKLSQAGIAKSSSRADELTQRNEATTTKRYIPFAVVGGLLLAAALIWFFANQQSGLIQAASNNIAPSAVIAVAPVAEVTTVTDAPPAKAVPVNDRIPDTQPLQRISPAPPEDTGKAMVEKNPEQEARLKSIERERDSALALAKTAEREAMRKVALARERALAAEREKALAQERERANQSALAAEKAKQEARAVETAAVVQVRKPEPVLPAQARTVADTRVEAGNDETGKEPTTFTANPCKGPSARFLSTCE